MRYAPKQFVVIVDDDQAMRDSISDYLNRAGYHVRCYQSGSEMLSEVDNLNIGVIVCDLKMPGMNGMEVLKALKSQENTSPFILITAFGDIPTAVKAIHMGAFDFIEKPFVPQVLRETIDLALEHHQLKADDFNKKNHSNTPVPLNQLLIGQSTVMTKFHQEIINCASTLHNLLLIDRKSVV